MERHPQGRRRDPEEWIGGFAAGQEHGHHGTDGPRPRYSRGQEHEPLTPEEKHRGDFAEGR